MQITQDVFKLFLGDIKYRRRMAIDTCNTRPLDKYVITKHENRTTCTMSAEEIVAQYQERMKHRGTKVVVSHEPSILSQTNENDPLFCYQCMEYCVVHSTEAVAVCPGCSESSAVDMPGFQYNYREGVSKTTTYTYRPMSHFIDHLSSLQGTGSTMIPQTVIDDVMEDIKIYRLGDKLTVEHVYHILKRKKLSNQYCNSMRIWSRITEKEGPRLNQVQVNILCEKFKQIEECWAQIRPESRKNIISYAFLLHKLCELLVGPFSALIPYLRLLKSREKLEKQEQMWKLICEHLEWTYIPCSYLDSDSC